MKKSLLALVSAVILLALTFSLASCGFDITGGSESKAYSVSGGIGGGGFFRSDAIYGDYYSVKDSVYDEGEPSEYEYQEIEISAGMMTAKAWNDNEYYEQWKKLFLQSTDNDPEGKFFDYTSNSWTFDTSKGGAPAVGVKVAYTYPNQTEWASKTDVNGVAYVFPNEDAGKVTVAGREIEFSAENRELSVELDAAGVKENVIKIMFVIDATGSMGDEMRYISAELTDVVSRVAERAEQVKIELSLLFYRDDDDQEKFAYHDFETVTEKSGLEKQLAVLKAQRADGGGDYPEAVDEAMVMAANKNWGDENSTKLMFLVLDAPPHENKDNITRCAEAVKVAAEKGIRICPILCSGADTLCEYLTRTGALLTGGTSIFVTDDSGIGGEHLDPDLPDAVVERLNDLMVRLIVGYHTGDFGTPIPYEPNNKTVEQ